jgi:hypothetical protein
MSNNICKLTEEYLDQHCQEKKYTVKKTPKENYIRIDVSNLSETVPLSLYKTGKLVVGGSPKLKLKSEFDAIKQKLSDSPEILGGVEIQKVKACSTRYTILLEKTREEIKNNLSSIDGAVNYFNSPTPSEEYRAKLSTRGNSVSVTQYKNGTLFLQGKDDSLFSSVCDLVEKIATPTDVEIISRFFANDETSLQKFTATYSPELLIVAEGEVRKAIGDEAFNFFEPYDQKWLVAAQCLYKANIPLPEFSPLIMPASKAFEGFIKKLLVKVGFYPITHFQSKTANFGYLRDKNHAERKKLEEIETHAGTYLDKIGVCLDTNRNFMMHSDGAIITKIDTYEEASSKLSEIHDDIKEVFTYFKKVTAFGL